MLNPDSVTPLYLQLKSVLQARIEDGTYGRSGRLPSERQLSQQFSISRMTARQALQALAMDGFIDVQVGKGTFVRQRQIAQELRHLTSFTEDMQQRGLDPDSRIIECRILLADEDVASHLQVLPGSRVGLLSRLRLADGEPLAWENCHLNIRLCPTILEDHDFSTASLYSALRQDYGIRLVVAQQLITARMPTPEERELLMIDPDVPVLALNRMTFDEAGQPIEYVNSVYRGDRYQLYTTLNLSASDERGVHS